VLDKTMMDISKNLFLAVKTLVFDLKSKFVLTLTLPAAGYEA
jgi:hypothetical protein